MHWLLLFVGVLTSGTVAQRWTDSVILTQHGPVPYKPVHHSRYGYYTADVLPVYPGDDKIEPVRGMPWPPYGNTFEVPITTGMNIGHPGLMTQMKTSPISMKRKKGTLKKNPHYHKIPPYEKPGTKMTTPRQKPATEFTYDQRFNNIRNPVPSGYAYRGRRFTNRGLKVRQSEKILKGQVIDHKKGREFENLRPQAISNKNDMETEDKANQYFNNGHQGPDLGYYHYSQPNRDDNDNSRIYYSSNVDK